MYKRQVQASQWIRDYWRELAKKRSDVTVELFNHSQWKQPSVIMTIRGSKLPQEVVVLGGHLDSIAGFWGRANARAPGADDNASGIATISEVIRLLVDGNYVPERTIKFMGYAAEEVGLRGSKEIVEKLYKLIPQQMFAAKIQTKALGRIIASRTIPALKKNVTQHMYGGDRTRKMKLWEKQKEGKKRMKAEGTVDIPHDVFLKMVQSE